MDFQNLRPAFYFENYVEIRGNGFVKGFRTNSTYSDNKFFSYNLPFNSQQRLSMCLTDPAIFQLTKINNSVPQKIYCGPVYKLELISLTERKFTFFDPLNSNSSQKIIIDLFDQMNDIAIKMQIDSFDIVTSMDKADYELRKYWSEPPVWQEIKFDPPR